jgi:hypothetical protein
MSSAEGLSLHPPVFLRRALSDLHLLQVRPEHITTDTDALYKNFRGLAGDIELGLGNYGNCQSWCGDWDWWKKFLREQTDRSSNGHQTSPKTPQLKIL